MQQNPRGIVAITSYKRIYSAGLKPLHNVDENVHCKTIGVIYELEPS
jgi:hypothetical protein